jgi:hypothetical protein
VGLDPKLARGYTRRIDERIRAGESVYAEALERLYQRIGRHRAQGGKLSPKAFASLGRAFKAEIGEAPGVLHAHTTPMRPGARREAAGEIGYRALSVGSLTRGEGGRSDVLDNRCYRVRCDYIASTPKASLARVWGAPVSAIAHVVERLIARGGAPSDGAGLPEMLDLAFACAGLWRRAHDSGLLEESPDIVVPAEGGVICGGFHLVDAGAPLVAWLAGEEVFLDRRGPRREHIPAEPVCAVLRTYVADDMMPPARRAASVMLRRWAWARRADLLEWPMAWFAWPGCDLTDAQHAMLTEFVGIVRQSGLQQLFRHQQRRLAAGDSIFGAF